MPNSTRQEQHVTFGAVLCDDIRKEDNGKLIIIGVYSGEILLNEFPATLGLAAYVNFSLPAGSTLIEMRFKFDDEIGPILEVAAEGASANITGIPTPRVPISCPQEGYLSLEVDFNKHGTWQEILKKRVVLRETFARESAIGAH